MKKKDLISLVVAIVIFVVVGYVAYTQLAPKSSGAGGGSSKQVQVVSITPIPSNIDPSQVSQLNDPSININYFQPFTFNNLGNNQPFGQ